MAFIESFLSLIAALCFILVAAVSGFACLAIIVFTVRILHNNLLIFQNTCILYHSPQILDLCNYRTLYPPLPIKHRMFGDVKAQPSRSPFPSLKGLRHT